MSEGPPGAASIVEMGQVVVLTMGADLSDQQATTVQKQVAERLRGGPYQAQILELSNLEVIDSFLGRIVADTATNAGVLGDSPRGGW